MTVAHPSLFISYRRADAGGHAGRLFDRLSHWFDADALFYDLDGVDMGENFPDRIARAINQAAVALVVIGPDWLQEINRRADQPEVDFEEHPGTLTSMNNLAITLHAQGDLAGAQALEEKALEVCRRVLGEEHPDTLASMNNLASTLRAQGDLAGAWALQEQELEASRRVLGEEHPDTLASMNNLASTLWSQGDLAGARALPRSSRIR